MRPAFFALALKSRTLLGPGAKLASISEAGALDLDTEVCSSKDNDEHSVAWVSAVHSGAATLLELGVGELGAGLRAGAGAGGTEAGAGAGVGGTGAGVGAGVGGSGAGVGGTRAGTEAAWDALSASLQAVTFLFVSAVRVLWVTFAL